MLNWACSFFISVGPVHLLSLPLASHKRNLKAFQWRREVIRSEAYCFYLFFYFFGSAILFSLFYHWCCQCLLWNRYPNARLCNILLESLWGLQPCTAWFPDMDDALSGWPLVMPNSHPTPGGFISQSLTVELPLPQAVHLHKWGSSTWIHPSKLLGGMAVYSSLPSWDASAINLTSPLCGWEADIWFCIHVCSQMPEDTG